MDPPHPFGKFFVMDFDLLDLHFVIVFCHFTPELISMPPLNRVFERFSLKKARGSFLLMPVRGVYQIKQDMSSLRKKSDVCKDRFFRKELSWLIVNGCSLTILTDNGCLILFSQCCASERNAGVIF